MRTDKLTSELLRYLVDNDLRPGDRVPTLSELSNEIGVSVGKLREQLELARQLGLVSVRPRLGIRREPFKFQSSVTSSLFFALATGEATFAQYSHLRRIVETSMWSEAVGALLPGDIAELDSIVDSAWQKLRGEQVHIPNSEHRQLHIAIFRRLNNPFMLGLLEAYWDAYEASELTRYADYQYWLDVWTYHEQIVESIRQGDIAEGKRQLVRHFALLPTVTIPDEYLEELSNNGR